MDRLVYTVLNSMESSQKLRAISANNLANMNVPGFRRDLPSTGESQRLADQETFQARLFQTEQEIGSFSSETGFLDKTGDDFDVAITGEGYFFASEGDGEPGLTRRGDLRTDGLNRLVNGANEFMLDQNMQPIELPPYRSLQITEVGQVLIEPVGGAEGEKLEVAVLATVIPDENMSLAKGMDGLIRPIAGAMPVPNQAASISQGVLEGSNVNSTEELIASIDLQRNFELNMRMITTAKELDEAGTEIMRAPGA